jgi:hypothetical protein
MNPHTFATKRQWSSAEFHGNKSVIRLKTSSPPDINAAPGIVLKARLAFLEHVTSESACQADRAKQLAARRTSCIGT